MKKCNRLISHLAFPIDYSIISINSPTTNQNRQFTFPRFQYLNLIYFSANFSKSFPIKKLGSYNKLLSVIDTEEPLNV